MTKPEQIDDSTRDDHHFLEPDDNCYYFGQYTAGQGFGHSKTNQLIWNLKKSVTLKAEYQYNHKIKAIDKVASILHSCLDPSAVTLVPVPPSKSKAHPEYDDRMTAILRRHHTLSGNKSDYRELVVQAESTEASHSTDDRVSIEKLEELYIIDPTLTNGVKGTIIIFDDMLTTGRHFKAMQSVLRKQFPAANIMGLFIARREAENPFADFIDDP